MAGCAAWWKAEIEKAAREPRASERLAAGRFNTTVVGIADAVGRDRIARYNPSAEAALSRT